MVGPLLRRAQTTRLRFHFLDQRGSHRGPIINVAWRPATCQRLTAIIDSLMQLEAREPAHAHVAASGICRKDPVLTDPFGSQTSNEVEVVKQMPVQAPKLVWREASVGAIVWHGCDKARVPHRMGKFAGDVKDPRDPPPEEMVAYAQRVLMNGNG